MTGNKTPSVLSFSFFLVLFYLCSSITSFQRSRSCGLSPFTWKPSLYYLSSFYYNGQKISILLPAIMFSYSVATVHCICSIGYTDTLPNPDIVSGSFGSVDQFKLSCTATSFTTTWRVGEKTSALHSPLEPQCVYLTQPSQIVVDSSLCSSNIFCGIHTRFTLCRRIGSMWTKLRTKEHNDAS